MRPEIQRWPRGSCPHSIRGLCWCGGVQTGQQQSRPVPSVATGAGYIHPVERCHVPVLIVGGSLTGLSTALFLARHGTASLTVERHPSTTIQYKFRGISPRSMEIFRDAGIEEA